MREMRVTPSSRLPQSRNCISKSCAVCNSSNSLYAANMLSGCVFLLLVVSTNVVMTSQSIIKTLPGFDGDLPFSLETGYIGVGYMEEVQLFYYFFESERSPGDDPLILWLTGGPGCSGFSAIVYETGPLTFNYANSSWKKPSFLLNPYSWTKVANVIFLDSPVGTGFSYSTSSEGYKISDLSSASQTYEFLRKWLVAHPKFLANPLYIAGDSYSGISVPLVVQEIYAGFEKADEPEMNLTGFILGNPLTDMNYDWNLRIAYAHEKALLCDELYESIKEECKGEHSFPDRSNERCIANLKAVNESFKGFYAYNIFEPKCAWNLSSFLEENSLDINSMPQLVGEWNRECNLLFSEIWANDKTVQNALQVREGTVSNWERCNSSLYYSHNVGRSSLKYHRNFTRSNLRSLIYSGDTDLAITYAGTHAWIQSLKLTNTSDWKPWFVRNQVAGYVMTYSKRKYSLTFATVKEAGHTAPEYKPEECFAMIDRWLGHNPL